MWPRIANIALGLWLMAAPAALGYSAPASTNDRIIGPVVASLAIIALAGATRGVRRANTALGIWLLAAPWLLGYTTSTTLHSMAVGALVTGVSLVRGTVKDRFGGGWAVLWRGGREGRPRSPGTGTPE